MTARVDELLDEVERLAAATRRGRRQRRAARPARPQPAPRVTVARPATARLLEGGPIADRDPDAPSPRTSRTFTRRARPRRRAWPSSSSARDAPSTVYLEQILRGCAKVGIEARFVELEGEATEAAVVAPHPRAQRRPDGRWRHRPDAAAADDPPARGHRRHRSGQGHRRHPPAQRRPAAPRLRRLPAGDRPRRGRDPAPLRDRDRGPGRGRHRSVGRRRHAGGVPAAQGGRDGHGLPLADDATSPATSARADIVVVAAGRPGLVTGDMLKPGAVVVDVGINVVDGRIVGDVDFAVGRRRSPRRSRPCRAASGRSPTRCC